MKLEKKTLCSITIWWKLTKEVKLKTKWVRKGEKNGSRNYKGMEVEDVFTFWAKMIHPKK